MGIHAAGRHFADQIGCRAGESKVATVGAQNVRAGADRPRRSIARVAHQEALSRHPVEEEFIVRGIGVDLTRNQVAARAVERHPTAVGADLSAGRDAVAGPQGRAARPADERHRARAPLVGEDVGLAIRIRQAADEIGGAAGEDQDGPVGADAGDGRRTVGSRG